MDSGVRRRRRWVVSERMSDGAQTTARVLADAWADLSRLGYDFPLGFKAINR